MTVTIRRQIPVVGKYAVSRIALTLGMVFFANPQANATNCADPAGPVARVICSDPDLIIVDEDMGDAFRELIRSTTRTDRPSILRAQRDWLNRRNRCLGAQDVGECLRVEIESRITDLSQGLAGTVGPDAPDNGFAPAVPDTGQVTGQPADRFPLGESGTVAQGRRDPVEQVPLSDVSDDRTPDSGTRLIPPRIGGNTAPVNTPGGNETPQDVTGSEITGGGATSSARPSADDIPSSPAPGGRAPLDNADAPAISAFLSDSVWRAEIASGVRPGTIYIFHSNGLLVTADCVESYRIGTWRVEGAGLRIEDGSGRKMTGEIVVSGAGYVQLKLTEQRENRVLDLVFRPARAPFSCTASR